MTAPLCVVGDGRVAYFRGFCVTCTRWMGAEWKKRITKGGASERRRAIEALRSHYSSIRTFGGGRAR